MTEPNKKRKSTGQATLSDVAKLAGVGTMTVSRALRTPDQVSDKLRSKIEEAVNILGYRPNLAASSLASAAVNNLVAIITPQIYDSSSRSLIDAIQKELLKEEYTATIIESRRLGNKMHLLFSAIRGANFTAVMLVNMQKHDPIRENLTNLNIPVINIGEANTTDENQVKIDNMQAMYKLTQAVIKKGFRYIGLLCANHEHIIFQQRLHGWHKAMLDNHLPTHRVINAAQPANAETGSQLLADFLLSWPEIDILMCTNDELACGVMYECQRRHIRIPYQLAVTGFGDNELSRVCYPTLTTISLSDIPIAKQAVACLLQQLEPHKSYKYDPITSFDCAIKMRDSW